MNQNITAKLRYLRIAPRKARLLSASIKGLTVLEAEGQLMLSSRRSSAPILKLLRSAVANAKNNSQLESSSLYIKEIKVDQGPKLKRFSPRARGNVNIIEKKASHITLILGVSDKLQQPKFTIPEKKKKEKAIKPEEKTKEKNKEEKPLAKVKPAKQGNFFKRVFRRKTI